MRISNAQQFAQGLTGILKLQTNTFGYQDQIISGKKVNTPADDPVAAAQILLISERITAAEQFNRNADFAILHLSQQDSTLGSAHNALQRIRELTIRSNTDSMTAADRRSIATEMRQRLDEMISLGNARNSAGEHIFAGSLVDTVPFTVDAAGNADYNGDQTARNIKISEFRSITEGFTGFDAFMAVRNGNGTYVTELAAANTGTGQIVPAGVVDKSVYQAHDFRISFTSATTFDVIDDTTATTILAAQTYTDGAAIVFNGIQLGITHAPAAGDEFLVAPSENQSVFDTVTRIIATLEAPATAPADAARFHNDLDRAFADIDQALDRFLEVRTSIGARLNTIETQQEVNADLKLQLQATRSKLEDIDLAEAVSLLARESNALQAAQAAFVRVQGLSLFNFL